MKLLIVDDEETARYGMRKALEREVTVLEAAGLKTARHLCREHQPGVILLDVNLGHENGLDLFDELQQMHHPSQVIVVTAHGNERVAVDAMKKGAFDYVAKPFDIEELRLIVRNAARQAELERENRRLREQLAEASGYGEMVGTSDAMREVYGIIEKAAPTDVTVLLLGESGSGKELVARELHRRSPRADGQLVVINCAAIPENLIESELFGHEKGAYTGASERRIGKFEQARGGTLFLDEVGDMPLETQAKLLRVIEERRLQRLGGNQVIEVDVRIISATNKDLASRVEQGTFREDLFYRLEVVRILVPPLRRRREDLPLLIEHFLETFCRKHGREVESISPAAMGKLLDYSYPGNVRQLRNILERLVVLNESGVIEPADLPPEVRFFVPAEGTTGAAMNLEAFFDLPFKAARESFEVRYLLWKLREHDQNITHTAEAIGIHRQSLQQKIRELNLRQYLDA